MRTAMVLTVTSFLSAGCMQGLEDEYRRAIPDQNELAIEVPGEGADAAAGSHEMAILGERAFLYQVTRDVSRIINGGVYLVLAILQDIVRHPATTIDEHHAVWGPWTGALSPLTYRFTVTKVDDDGNYEYVLEAKPKTEADDSYAAILTGAAHVNGQDRGRGSFVVDADAMHALDEYEWPGSGVATVDYDVQAEPLTVNVGFENWTGGWHAPIDATYHYAEAADQSGEFSYDATADVDENFSALESLTVASRWVAGGSGRSDASVTGGDVAPGVSVTATECWDDVFGRTYWTDSMGIQQTEGEASACVFDSAAATGE